jgi:DNA-binding response OmpR family regulator
MMDGKPRILLVDDNAGMRELIAGLLTEEGFAVVEAADGVAALKRLANGDFDLMITDVRLPPPLGGVDTVRLARLRWPRLRSLFISGASEPVYDDRELDDFVSKPFDARELLGCVWELLTREVPEARLRPAQIGAAMAFLEGRISVLSHCRDSAISAGDARLGGVLSAELSDATGVRDWIARLRAEAAG